ncbi:GNAT family N-acetyltransferase [Chryseobacterium sp. PMSZPI]|uniref:GNAT family N-acetyltransferase n=1 Tax=Chryseobacterium sp. PMSZPI TaxID=1033900 RepID=UPI000C34CF8D|nr:GNAT family N-acetyltransferase [Chryseobacterium sp. PMSZPI]PKF75318.1 hypothetical protein CW752_05025 [Chryseobacterium sp. PMSZPI]
MENTTETLPSKLKFDNPVKVTKPEPWQWKLLAKAFLHDQVTRFLFGENVDETILENFFESIVKDTLISGGEIFCSPDQKAILVWTWLGNDSQTSNEFKRQVYEILGTEGTNRYHWLYEEGDIQLDMTKAQKSMEPAFVAVHPEKQGQGYGGHIFKWTLEYFDKKGYYSPYILASSKRSAKLYCSLLGYYAHKEIFIPKEDEPIAILLKRIE